MEVTAHARNIRMSARKVRLVADVVRGMTLMPALAQLRFIPKAASTPVGKVLLSAMANAEHNFQLDKNALFIKTITVDMGMPLKRWRARAFGRAAPIVKHSCHITVVLAPKAGVDAKMTKKAMAAAEHDHAEHEGLPHTEAHMSVTHDVEAGHAPEALDVRRMGKHRNAQNADRLGKKGAGGSAPKVFNRKAG